MDDLEFRRRLLADPNDKSTDILSALEGSSQNRQFIDELQQLDNQIEQVLKIDVPDDLADRILFNQVSEQPVPAKAPRKHLAIAASVAFFCGLLLGQTNWQEQILPSAQASMSDTALTHVYDEAPFVNQVDEAVSLAQVNAKLAPFGKEFSHDLPGHIYYVNHCAFGHMNALHVVMQGEKGKITIFVVPEKSHNEYDFNDAQMKGTVIPLQKASMIVVGEQKEDIKPIVENLMDSLNLQA